MELRAVELPVRSEPPPPIVAQVEAAYVARYGADPEDRSGWYRPDDWLRISRVLDRLDRGGDLLDVGSGAGQFVNCVALAGEHRSVTSVDRGTYTRWTELADGIRKHQMSIAALDFPDDHFDVVTCMEVIEHLPDEIFHDAIAELRRVCRGQLVITVPYREPEPISRWHLRRFEDEDLLALFPTADFTILRRPKKPWVMAVERPNSRAATEAVRLLADNERLQARVRRSEDKVRDLRARRVVRVADRVGKEARRLADEVSARRANRSSSSDRR